MSRNDELNWSTDLLRISWWLQTGNISLAKKFIDRGEKMYGSAKKVVAQRAWSWWFSEIKSKDNLKAAERALTWSALLR